MSRACSVAGTRSVRGAVDRNMILVIVAGVLLTGAAVIVFATSGGETVEISEDLAAQMMPVSCSRCQATWEMPYGDYQKESEAAAADGAGGIVCGQCGEESAWKPVTAIPTPPPTAAADTPPGADPEAEGAEDDEPYYEQAPTPATAKPAFGAVKG